MNGSLVSEARQPRFQPPSGAADLLIVRHGETQSAVRGECFPMMEGQGDPSLRAEGWVQAAAISERLGAEPIAAVYVTTMRRTHQTAAPLAEHLNLVPIVEPDLREVFLGDWDGGEYRFRAAENDPAFIRAKARQEWGEIPGAETTDALHARVRASLLRIAQSHADELVVVVAHGGVIAAALAVATGAPAFTFSGADNGSISRLVVHGEQMTLRGFNDVSHLRA